MAPLYLLSVPVNHGSREPAYTLTQDPETKAASINGIQPSLIALTFCFSYVDMLTCPAQLCDV